MNAGVELASSTVPVASPIATAYASLAAMSETEFGHQLQLLSLAQERAAMVKRQLMKDGVHYGVIPGTDKPTLLKPGAEVLLQAFGLVADFKWDVIDGDGVTSPALRVIMRALIHVHSTEGPIVAIGVAEANTFEKKHRRRRAQKSCPECGRSAIGKSKAEYGGGYYCNGKAGGCGAKFRPGSDAANQLDAQEAGEIDNPDPHDLGNTIVKMSKKRALIDATLTATASSDLFTQDMDEMDQAEQAALRAPRQQSAPAPVARSIAIINRVVDLDDERRAYGKALAKELGAKGWGPKSLDACPAALDELERWLDDGSPIEDAQPATAPAVAAEAPIDTTATVVAQGDPRVCGDCGMEITDGNCGCPFRLEAWQDAPPRAGDSVRHWWVA